MKLFEFHEPTARPVDVNIVVSCTNTKRRPVPEHLKLRNIPPGPARRRATAWIERLAEAEAPAVSARDLYGGDHWANALALPRLAEESGFDARLWVVSAGYGLIPVDYPVHPYSATFSTTSPDSVGPTRAHHAVWWRTLTEAYELNDGLPRTLTHLAAGDPKASILIAAAPNYLYPLADDLNQAAAVLSDPDQLLVVSAGMGGGDSRINPHLIPSDARLSNIVNGSRVSLNVRTAGLVLSQAKHSGLTSTAVARAITAILSDLPPPTTYDRQPLADADVIEYLQEQLRLRPSASATRLLRDLRDSGRACEQSRFHRLYRSVAAEQ